MSLITSPPVRVRSDAMRVYASYYLLVMSVYLSAHISQTITWQNFNKSSVAYMLPVAVARSSSERPQYNTLYTSGFVDDVMFAHNGLHGAWPCNRANSQSDLPEGSTDSIPSAYGGWSKLLISEQHRSRDHCPWLPRLSRYSSDIHQSYIPRLHQSILNNFWQKVSRQMLPHVATSPTSDSALAEVGNPKIAPFHSIAVLLHCQTSSSRWFIIYSFLLLAAHAAVYDS